MIPPTKDLPMFRKLHRLAGDQLPLIAAAEGAKRRELICKLAVALFDAWTESRARLCHSREDFTLFRKEMGFHFSQVVMPLLESATFSEEEITLGKQAVDGRKSYWISIVTERFDETDPVTAPTGERADNEGVFSDVIAETEAWTLRTEKQPDTDTVDRDPIGETEPSAAAARERTDTDAVDRNSIASERRRAVDEYIAEGRIQGIPITRKAIWQKAGYKSRTEFERWERNDRRATATADRYIRRVLEEKPHLSKATGGKAVTKLSKRLH